MDLSLGVLEAQASSGHNRDRIFFVVDSVEIRYLRNPNGEGGDNVFSSKITGMEAGRWAYLRIEKVGERRVPNSRSTVGYCFDMDIGRKV